MTDFEVFTVVLSFILGMGIAQLLASGIHLVQSRGETRLHWVPLLLAGIIFLLHVSYLWASLNFFSVERTALWYYVDLLSVVLLFVGGGLILPSAAHPLPPDLGDFFSREGRLALIPIALYELSSIPYNLQYGLSPLAAPNVVHYLALPFLLLVYLGRARRGRAVGATIWAALMVYGVLFVWAGPGAP